MVFSDGRKTAEIRICMYDNRTDNMEDWTMDFFEVGGLEYDEENDQYIVEDVDYLIEQAEDWREGRGDFSDPDLANYEEGSDQERLTFIDVM